MTTRHHTANKKTKPFFSSLVVQRHYKEGAKKIKKNLNNSIMVISLKKKEKESCEIFLGCLFFNTFIKLLPLSAWHGR